MERGAQRDQRQIELETKLAFLERTLEELNEVVIEQARALEAVQLELRRVRELLPSSDASRAPGVDLGDPLAERPPHY